MKEGFELHQNLLWKTNKTKSNFLWKKWKKENKMEKNEMTMWEDFRKKGEVLSKVEAELCSLREVLAYHTSTMRTLEIDSEEAHMESLLSFYQYFKKEK